MNARKSEITPLNIPLDFKEHSGIFTLHVDQYLNTDIEKAWDFLSSPANLALITPPELGFVITSSNKEMKMYAGQIISYKVSPLAGIAVNWITEISHVSEPYYFADEQRFGPYAFWHHKHFLEETAQGVRVTDIVDYKLPFGLIGNLAHRWFVRQKLQAIFTHRYQVMEHLFGFKNHDRG